MNGDELVMLDGLQEILYTLRRNKLRTVLTAFGVFWGIFMLILLLGFGRGMQNRVLNDFGSDVLDFIMIWSGDTSVAYRGRGLARHIQFEQGDVEAIKEQIPGVRLISAESQIAAGTVTFEGKNSTAGIHGIPDEYFKIKEDVPFHVGRKPNQLDVDEIRKVVVIGTVVAERLFAPGVDPVGQQVRLEDVVMKVTGVFYDKGNRERDSERVFMPLSTYRKIYGSGERIDMIWLRPTQGVDGFELEEKVVELLKRRHDVAPEDIRAIRSFNMATPATRVNGLFTGITIFIWFVGLGTLTAGIVGISNIMIITVKERTREIGIRKALGATPFSIVSTLLLESALVTSVAGYLGLVLAVGLLELVSFAVRSTGAQLPYFLNPEVDFQVAMTAIVLLIVVGLLAGLMPAVRAAQITPIEAMRAG
jgi:putative ABC transport system permease protein